MPPAKPASKGKGRPGSGNILNFFKPLSQPDLDPVPASAPAPAPAPAPEAQTPSRPLPSIASPSPLPPSSPLSRTTTPARPAVTEIAASDDDSDGSSSDDSLEDLSTLLGHSRPSVAAAAPQPKPQHDPYATPRAKRTAVGFHASPLAIMSRHKFDLKSLANDARRDDATTASSLRVKAAADEAAAQSPPSTGNLAAAGEAVLEIVRERGGQDARKVLRAVQRAAPGQAQLRYCFFDTDYSVPLTPPAPKGASRGPWRLLTLGNTQAREQYLASGVPQIILRKTKTLPDALLEWILDDLCTQPSIVTRQEYCNMVADCPVQVERLVTLQRLQDLFIRLGANDDIKPQGGELDVSNSAGDPYEGRDWSCLRSFLGLLGLLSSHLSVAAVKFATQTLLRMSMDRFLICNIDVLSEYEGAIQSLADAIPSSSWDSFCLETCSMLHAGIKAQNIRANALLCLPVSSRRVHDLRRRLAVVFLFNDTTLARHNAENVVTVRGVIDLLDGDEFAIHPQTDFAELKASILLLDMAVDDGSVVAFNDRRDETRFNDDVDELAARLREIWRKINDSGMKLARTEAKSVVEWVQQRLSNMVRTRRKAKKSVFDLAAQEENPFSLRQQQDYMKKFLRKEPKPPTEEDNCIIVARVKGDST